MKKAPYRTFPNGISPPEKQLLNIKPHVVVGIGCIDNVVAEGGSDDVPAAAAEQPASISKDAITARANRIRRHRDGI
jgi:hypothetical protein